MSKMRRDAEPVAEAPVLYGAQTPAGELLPWDWARRRLEDAQDYWIATTCPDGKPHTRPVWGVWVPGGFWFSTGSLARRNLVENPLISVHLPGADNVVIVEGFAEPGVAALDAMNAYNAKYSWNFRPDGDGVVDGEGNEGSAHLVRPGVVFGWVADMRAPTRWRFGVA